MSEASGGLVLGLLVPCRNEAAVIERKLRNLALCLKRWPGSPPRHRIVVVDDESDDDTAALATRLCAELFPPEDDEAAARAEVIPNSVRPGKAGAIASGLEVLAERAPVADIAVLTDADVVFAPDALALLERAFRTRAELDMACGSQLFVVDLAADGTPRGADFGPPEPSPGRYDRWTAAVRAWESRSGRLFSVHGQLLAWRTALGLAPTPGIAADDLDLMLQVREAAGRVEKLEAVRFLEVKTPRGPAQRRQEVRRARAYVQLIRERPFPAERDLPGRLQMLFYRRLPLASPWLGLAGLILAPLLVHWWADATAAALTLAVLLGLLLALPAGRRFARLLLIIARATLIESRGSLGDRWEMARS